VIVHTRQLPPTRDERRATARARWARWFRHTCTVAAVLAPFVLSLGLYVAVTGERGWGLTIALGSLLGLAAAIKRFS
jgi:hypothetical protein